MDLKEILQLPFVQVALPVIMTFALATMFNGRQFSTISKRIDDVGKRIDDLRGDMNRQFGEVTKRLDKIESKLENHGERITRLEERTSPFTSTR